MWLLFFSLAFIPFSYIVIFFRGVFKWMFALWQEILSLTTSKQNSVKLESFRGQRWNGNLCVLSSIYKLYFRQLPIHTDTHTHTKHLWIHFWNRIFGNWCLVNIVYRVGTPLRWQSLMIMCMRWITQFTCVFEWMGIYEWMSEWKRRGSSFVSPFPGGFFSSITQTQAHATTITNIVQLKSKSHGVFAFKLSIYSWSKSIIIYLSIANAVRLFWPENICASNMIIIQCSKHKSLLFFRFRNNWFIFHSSC